MVSPRTTDSKTTTLQRRVDPALTQPPDPDIPIDQLMQAVDGVIPYVKSHLGRFGFLEDMKDVLQEIRVAAWNEMAKGNYRAIPGIPYEAWVQGIARNLCADQVRRNLATIARPLPSEWDACYTPLTDIQLIAVEDQVTNDVWAIGLLRLVKAMVPEESWDLAVECLAGQQQGKKATVSNSSGRKRWEAVAAVRQMAITIRSAMDVDQKLIVDRQSLQAAAVGALPSALYQLIAARIVIPGSRKEERALAIAAVAQEAGVSIRYVEVQIGGVRSLLLAAESVLKMDSQIGIARPGLLPSDLVPTDRSKLSEG